MNTLGACVTGRERGHTGTGGHRYRHRAEGQNLWPKGQYPWPKCRWPEVKGCGWWDTGDSQCSQFSALKGTVGVGAGKGLDTGTGTGVRDKGVAKGTKSMAKVRLAGDQGGRGYSQCSQCSVCGRCWMSDTGLGVVDPGMSMVDTGLGVVDTALGMVGTALGMVGTGMGAVDTGMGVVGTGMSMVGTGLGVVVQGTRWQRDRTSGQSADGWRLERTQGSSQCSQFRARGSC